ncbi:uncharacterized protein LOC115067226 isoform X11 [Nannospalax galili]|uniref:uncharacterized protein LOC115067226 isoform X11 n=1 Tax=Nannospalax galili TaxID=1026970 RepID=UPI00111BD3EA|nr:uncharacterized protein LOC115067226 isoform X11 [Nannospalax galili]
MQLKDDSKKDYQEIRLAVYPGVTVLEDGGLAYPTASDPAEQRPPLTIWPNRASETHSLSFTWDPTMPHYVHRVWNEGFMSQLGKHQLRKRESFSSLLETKLQRCQVTCVLAQSLPLEYHLMRQNQTSSSCLNIQTHRWFLALEL